jgi:hypothetical protein
MDVNSSTIAKEQVYNNKCDGGNKKNKKFKQESDLIRLCHSFTFIQQTLIGATVVLVLF